MERIISIQRCTPECVRYWCFTYAIDTIILSQSCVFVFIIIGGTLCACGHVLYNIEYGRLFSPACTLIVNCIIKMFMYNDREGIILNNLNESWCNKTKSITMYHCKCIFLLYFLQQIKFNFRERFDFIQRISLEKMS